MNNLNLSIGDAIELAIEAENKAEAFYKDAASKVSSERGKDLLNQLADFEGNHSKKLNELKTSLEKDGIFIQYKGTQFKQYKASVPSEVAWQVETNKDELSDILSLAIDAETKASDRYRKMAGGTSDPAGKEMFMKLAEEETLHRRILSDEYYQLNNRGEVWFWGD